MSLTLSNRMLHVKRAGHLTPKQFTAMVILFAIRVKL